MVIVSQRWNAHCEEMPYVNWILLFEKYPDLRTILLGRLGKESVTLSVENYIDSDDWSYRAEAAIRVCYESAETASKKVS